EMLVEGLPDGSPKVAYAVLASLTTGVSPGCIQGSQFHPSFATGHLQRPHSRIGNRGVQKLGLSEDDVDSSIRDIVDRADLFARIWNESMGKQPSPHYYVAKEGWFMICGDRSNPDPSRMLLLSGSFSATSTTVMEFLREARPLIRDL